MKKTTDTLHIPEARFVGPDGTTQLVQPVLEDEKYLRPGRVAYNPDKHHMKLMCPYCDVRVDFNKGSGAAICGTQLEGARAHFKKAPHQEHDKKCDLPQINSSSNSEIDLSAPYRIHLNMLLGGKYDAERPVYERAEGGKVIALDPRLQPEEITIVGEDKKTKIIKKYKQSVPIKNIQDLIDLMKKGEGARLKQSLVVHNTVVPWTDFAILNEKRMRGLVDRLLNGASHPVLLHVGLYRAADGLRAEGGKTFYNRDNKGAHFIIPHIYMDGPETEDAFPVRGNYLVVGIPRLNFNKESGAYFLNISLKSPAQVMAYSPAELLAEARARAEKRQISPAP